MHPVELEGIRRLPIIEATLAAWRRPADVIAAVERHGAEWQRVYEATQSGNQAAVGAELLAVLKRANPSYQTNADLARAWRLLPQALATTDPRLMANRQVASALRTLTLDRDITGAMTSPRSFSTAYQYGRRLEREQTFGYHGDGSDAGKTIYASLQFGDETVALPYTDNLVAVGPATGAWTYGRASLEFKPPVAARTTIAPADLVLQARPEQIGGVEQLRSVTMERLANDRELMAQINLVDDATATRTLSAYLRSGDMAPYDVKLDGYMEAQVRGGATTSDLRRVIVNPRAVAGMEVPLRDQRAIADAASKLGIETRFAPGIEVTTNPHVDDWWKNFPDGTPREGVKRVPPGTRAYGGEEAS